MNTIQVATQLPSNHPLRVVGELALPPGGARNPRGIARAGARPWGRPARAKQPRNPHRGTRGGGRYRLRRDRAPVLRCPLL